MHTPLGFREYLLVEGVLVDLRDLMSELTNTMKSATPSENAMPPQVIHAFDHRTANITPLVRVEFAPSSAACSRSEAWRERPATLEESPPFAAT